MFVLNNLIQQTVLMMPHPFSSNVTVMAPMGSNLEGIELAGRTMEKMLHGDGQFPSLQDKLRVGRAA